MPGITVGHLSRIQDPLVMLREAFWVVCVMTQLLLPDRVVAFHPHDFTPDATLQCASSATLPFTVNWEYGTIAPRTLSRLPGLLKRQKSAFATPAINSYGEVFP